MSNEYKDWILDRIGDAALDCGIMDRVDEIFEPHEPTARVRGRKNGETVYASVWLIWMNVSGKLNIEKVIDFRGICGIIKV